ncbi:DUF3261 domain-containing protein [Comamonas sp. UBA7528]|uniref:DUF3261 domain-containing protein n=1 Tax=Comamonas sp. UBA7528 TaxID=1946391 RepID=UPI0025C4AA91|nr:DUF3261 domain-containing protein [Comamonas sp. UBA7528]
MVAPLSAWSACVAVCVLTGCASGPVATGAAPLQLALAPAALGCSVAVQQQLTVQPPSAAVQTLDALLEVDGQAVHLALFHMGQRMGVLHWDGQQLQTELSRWWPAQLPPAQVLSDLQLALWPVAAIAQALPAGWQVQEAAQGRLLSYKGQVRTDVLAAGAGAFDIRYVPAGWSLHVASPGGLQPCAVGQEAP